MRAIVVFTTFLALVGSGAAWAESAPQDAKADAKSGAVQSTPAAELTRMKSLKTKVSLSFNEARLGDILKELTAQVDSKADQTLLWAYGPEFPFAMKVSYSCKNKSLDAVLDELFKKSGGLGYVVISRQGDRRDGWVLVTTTGERGFEKPEVKLTDAEEAAAAEKLALAKKLIDLGKADQAKTVLTFLTKKYPTAKVAVEVKELLAKLDK